jgi:hypothetical protein
MIASRSARVLPSWRADRGGGVLWGRGDLGCRQDDENITVCTRCTARIYVRTGAEGVIDEAGLWSRASGSTRF